MTRLMHSAVREQRERAMGSEGERALETRLRQYGIAFEREVVFAPPRKWRADFRIGSLLVEVDGGTWATSRHTTPDGFAKDCEKQSAAAIAGYRVIRCTTDQVESDDCIDWIREALG